MGATWSKARGMMPRLGQSYGLLAASCCCPLFWPSFLPHLINHATLHHLLHEPADCNVLRLILTHVHLRQWPHTQWVQMAARNGLHSWLTVDPLNRARVVTPCWCCCSYCSCCCWLRHDECAPLKKTLGWCWLLALSSPATLKLYKGPSPPPCRCPFA